MAEEPTGRGIWLRDWSSDARTRMGRQGPAPASRPLLTIRPVISPLLKGTGAVRRYAPKLAKTVLSRAPLVLRNVAQKPDRGRTSLLTVQSPPPANVMVATPNTVPPLEPETVPAEEAGVEAAAPFETGPDFATEKRSIPAQSQAPERRGLFAGATALVLRVLRRSAAPDDPGPAEHAAPADEGTRAGKQTETGTLSEDKEGKSIDGDGPPAAENATPAIEEQADHEELADHDEQADQAEAPPPDTTLVAADRPPNERREPDEGPGSGPTLPLILREPARSSGRAQESTPAAPTSAAADVEPARHLELARSETAADEDRRPEQLLPEGESQARAGPLPGEGGLPAGAASPLVLRSEVIRAAIEPTVPGEEPAQAPLLPEDGAGARREAPIESSLPEGLPPSPGSAAGEAPIEALPDAQRSDEPGPAPTEERGLERTEPPQARRSEFESEVETDSGALQGESPEIMRPAGRPNAIGGLLLRFRHLVSRQAATEPNLAPEVEPPASDGAPVPAPVSAPEPAAPAPATAETGASIPAGMSEPSAAPVALSGDAAAAPVETAASPLSGGTHLQDVEQVDEESRSPETSTSLEWQSSGQGPQPPDLTLARVQAFRTVIGPNVREDGGEEAAAGQPYRANAPGDEQRRDDQAGGPPGVPIDAAAGPANVQGAAGPASSPLSSEFERADPAAGIAGGRILAARRRQPPAPGQGQQTSPERLLLARSPDAQRQGDPGAIEAAGMPSAAESALFAPPFSSPRAAWMGPRADERWGEGGIEPELMSVSMAPAAAPYSPLVYRTPRPAAAAAPRESRMAGVATQTGLSRGLISETEFPWQEEYANGATSPGQAGVLRTWVAPQAAIELQGDAPPGAEAAQEGAAAAAGPAAAGPAAAGPAGEGATPSPAALDKMAQEVYERLRRRLLVERERAGMGGAYQ